MTSIGTQAREAAARSQSESQSDLSEKAEIAEASEKANKAPSKLSARERVAATAEAVFGNRYMPGAKIHSASDAFISELRDHTLDRSTGGEGDLTERDAFKTFSKVAHQAVELPMGGLAMAVRNEYREAAGKSDSAEPSEPGTTIGEQIKKSFQDGVKSTKAAPRRRDDGGMEL